MANKQVVQNSDGTLSFIITLDAPVAGTVEQAFLETYPPPQGDTTPQGQWAMKKTIDYLQEVVDAWHIQSQVRAAQDAAKASTPQLGL